MEFSDLLPDCYCILTTKQQEEGLAVSVLNGKLTVRQFAKPIVDIGVGEAFFFLLKVGFLIQAFKF
jgi:hypothetical protein